MGSGDLCCPDLVSPVPTPAAGTEKCLLSEYVLYIIHVGERRGVSPQLLYLVLGVRINAMGERRGVSPQLLYLVLGVRINAMYFWASQVAHW